MNTRQHFWFWFLSGMLLYMGSLFYGIIYFPKPSQTINSMFLSMIGLLILGAVAIGISLGIAGYGERYGR